MAIRQLRGLVDDSERMLGKLTGPNLAAYAKTFAALTKPKLHATQVERDIREALAERGALPLDVQQMHAIRQLIVSAFNRW